MKNKLSVILATLALVVALGVAIYDVYLLSHLQGLTFGGTTNYDSLSLSEDLTVSGTMTLTATSTISRGDITLNGFAISGRQTPMTNSSTTLCSFRNPVKATSSLLYMVVDFGTTATSVSTYFQIGTSTQITGTSSALYTARVKANELGNAYHSILFASTTPPATNNLAGETYLVAPDQYVNVVQGDDFVGTRGGTCSALFMSI